MCCSMHVNDHFMWAMQTSMECCIRTACLQYIILTTLARGRARPLLFAQSNVRCGLRLASPLSLHMSVWGFLLRRNITLDTTYRRERYCWNATRSAARARTVCTRSGTAAPSVFEFRRWLLPWPLVVTFPLDKLGNGRCVRVACVVWCGTRGARGERKEGETGVP